MSGYNWKTTLDLCGNTSIQKMFYFSLPAEVNKLTSSGAWGIQEKVEPRGEMEVERDNCSRSAYSLVFHLRPASDSVNVWLECWKSLQRLKYRHSSSPAAWKQCSIQLALRVTRNHYFGKQPVHTLWEMMYMENRQQATPATTFTHSTVNIELGWGRMAAAMNWAFSL